ncbi:MAG TPA: OmpA family protein [Phycicoccus sp.]|nr:OmpA family protein [Phycicoccus sp.]
MSALMLRRLAPAGAALALTLVVAPSAAAEDPTVGSLRSFSQAELDASIFDLEPRIADLDPRMEDVAVTKGTEITLNADILFEFGKADLTPTAKAKIADLTAGLPQGGAATVTGHTDSIGDDASNLTLSQQRAQAVADAISAARSDLRLTVVGKGESDPVEPNEQGGEDNPEGRAKNRRVTVIPG